MDIKEIWSELGKAYCFRLDRAINTVVLQFRDKYFTYDDWSVTQPDCIDWESDRLSYNWQLGDYFFSLSDIYTALWYDIPEDILLEWYDATVDEALKKSWKVIPNLENFYKIKIKNGQAIKTTDWVWPSEK